MVTLYESWIRDYVIHTFPSHSHKCSKIIFTISPTKGLIQRIYLFIFHYYIFKVSWPFHYPFDPTSIYNFSLPSNHEFILLEHIWLVCRSDCTPKMEDRKKIIRQTYRPSSFASSSRDLSHLNIAQQQKELSIII